MEIKGKNWKVLDGISLSRTKRLKDRFVTFVFLIVMGMAGLSKTKIECGVRWVNRYPTSTYLPANFLQLIHPQIQILIKKVFFLRWVAFALVSMYIP